MSENFVHDVLVHYFVHDVVALNNYSLKLLSGENLPAKLLYQIDKSEIFVSPSTQLSGIVKMAHIETSELAEQFLSACDQIFRKRYGLSVKVKIVRIDERGSGRIMERCQTRISSDSVKIREKLEKIEKSKSGK